MTVSDLYAILPVLVVIGWGVLLMIADVFISPARKNWTALLAAVGLTVGLGVSLSMAGRSAVAFGGMAVTDGFSTFLDVLFTVVGLAGVGLAYDYLKRMNAQRGEYYTLLLFSIGGMMLMAHAHDLLLFFLALELLSIPLYILSGFLRPRLQSEEAALKYFLLGAFSSGFLLYGIALTFGATATTSLPGVVEVVRSGAGNMPLLLAGIALLVVGFGFKVAAVPFHMWTPDVYQGAPTPIVGFMSTATKAAGFAALLRLAMVLFPAVAADLTPVLWGLAAVTMLVGNLVALAQTNIKRMLAYSSIAHAGYLLLGLTAAQAADVAGQAVAAMLFYLAAYGITNIGAWAVVTAAEQAEGRGLELEDYAGLGRKYPWLGLSMLVFMLSFTGIPLTLGFWGKYYLFFVAVEGGFYALAIVALVASLISAYYYLRVVVYMFFREGDGTIRRDSWLSLITLGSAVAVIALALIPGQLLQTAVSAFLRLP
ncbi:MAG TPA: NADH-quinone oxidoreductase subunit N [Anaerolineaceae bacterium]|nr:NADH-quinone oxidoreductase subunit N [Anaerolineaceae bacterium]